MEKKNYQWDGTVFHTQWTSEVDSIPILQMGKLRLLKVSQLLGSRRRLEYSLVQHQCLHFFQNNKI